MGCQNSKSQKQKPQKKYADNSNETAAQETQKQQQKQIKNSSQPTNFVEKTPDQLPSIPGEHNDIQQIDGILEKNQPIGTGQQQKLKDIRKKSQVENIYDQNNSKENDINNQKITQENSNIPACMYKQSREEANRLKMNSTQYTGYLKYLSQENIPHNEDNAQDFIAKYQTKYSHTYNNQQETTGDNVVVTKEARLKQMNKQKQLFLQKMLKSNNQQIKLNESYDIKDLLQEKTLTKEQVNKILEKYESLNTQSGNLAQDIKNEKKVIDGLHQVIDLIRIQQDKIAIQGNIKQKAQFQQQIARIQDLHYQKKEILKQKLKLMESYSKNDQNSNNNNGGFVRNNKKAHTTMINQEKTNNFLAIPKKSHFNQQMQQQGQQRDETEYDNENLNNHIQSIIRGVKSKKYNTILYSKQNSPDFGNIRGHTRSSSNSYNNQNTFHKQNHYQKQQQQQQLDPNNIVRSNKKAMTQNYSAFRDNPQFRRKSSEKSQNIKYARKSSEKLQNSRSINKNSDQFVSSLKRTDHKHQTYNQQF